MRARNTFARSAHINALSKVQQGVARASLRASHADMRRGERATPDCLRQIGSPRMPMRGMGGAAAAPPQATATRRARTRAEATNLLRLLYSPTRTSNPFSLQMLNVQWKTPMMVTR